MLNAPLSRRMRYEWNLNAEKAILAANVERKRGRPGSVYVLMHVPSSMRQWLLGALHPYMWTPRRHAELRPAAAIERLQHFVALFPRKTHTGRRVVILAGFVVAMMKIRNSQSIDAGCLGSM